MGSMSRWGKWFAAGMALALAMGVSSAQAPSSSGGMGAPSTLGTGFSFQGSLSDASGPVDGICAFVFGLYDVPGSGSPPTGGTLVGTDTQIAVPVTRGSFSVMLNQSGEFGASAFSGQARWLQITVNCGSGLSTLSPRQALTATPYALYAASSSSGHSHWDQTWSGSGTGLTLAGGQVGLSSAGGTGIKGTGTAADGRGVFGHAAATEGQAIGVYGQSDADAGKGVYGTGPLGVEGYSTNQTLGIGVYGHADGVAGFGVWGYSDGGIGVRGNSGSEGKGVWGTGKSGVVGESSHASGWGVYGHALSTSGTAQGVYGQSDADSGTGVYGKGTYGVRGEGTSSSQGAGVYGTGSVGIQGESNSGDKRGVFGAYTGTSNSGVGVWGETSSTLFGAGVYGKGPEIGVLGTCTFDQLCAGVEGFTSGQSSWGVHGDARSSQGSAVGVFGESSSYSGKGVYGLSKETTGIGTGVQGVSSSTSGRGVTGHATAETGETYGVIGYSDSISGYAGFFRNTKCGVGLRVMTSGSCAGTPTILEAMSGFSDVEFKVMRNGDVYADGAYRSPAADYAELLPGSGGLEPGDVLAIGPDGQLVRSTSPYQVSVAGVMSTDPAFVAGVAEDGAASTGEVPLAVMGVVPVKVSAENGAIVPGDLLTSSSTPGHAMRAGPEPPAGTIIGKALVALDADTGVIEMLVMLR